MKRAEAHSTIDRRRMITAAAAAGGVAWVTPSVLSLDRAFAGASCGLTGLLNWNTVGVGNPFTSVTYPASGGYPALTITLANSTILTPTAQTGNETVQLSPNPYGGQTSPYYKYFMICNAVNEGYNGLFTFSAPVWNLRFTIFDIDRQNNGGGIGFQDKVFLTSAAAFTFTQPTGGTVTGSGTAGSPWVGTGNTAVGNNSTAGNVTVTFAGPVSSFTISFRSGNLLNNQQSVGLSNFTFCR